MLVFIEIPPPGGRHPGAHRQAGHRRRRETCTRCARLATCARLQVRLARSLWTQPASSSRAQRARRQTARASKSRGRGWRRAAPRAPSPCAPVSLVAQLTAFDCRADCRVGCRVGGACIAAGGWSATSGQRCGMRHARPAAWRQLGNGCSASPTFPPSRPAANCRPIVSLPQSSANALNSNCSRCAGVRPEGQLPSLGDAAHGCAERLGPAGGRAGAGLRCGRAPASPPAARRLRLGRHGGRATSRQARAQGAAPNQRGARGSGGNSFRRRRCRPAAGPAAGGAATAAPAPAAALHVWHTR